VRDDGESAEQKIAGVGHDGSTARSDFVAGFEFEEFAESPVDVKGGVEFFGVADEESGEVGLLELRLVAGGVVRAEARLRIEEGLAAAASTGEAVLAVGGKVDGNSARGSFRLLGSHGEFLSR